MARVTISLPDHLKAFVEEEIAVRGYASASEYISLLVQLAQLHKHGDQTEQLVRDGLDSGPATPMLAQDWEDIRQEIDKRLAKEKSKPKRKSRPA